MKAIDIFTQNMIAIMFIQTGPTSLNVFEQCIPLFHFYKFKLVILLFCNIDKEHK